jgi:hypothetical protein
MPDLFISHTPQDHELTAALAAELADDDIWVLTEDSELHLGDSLRQAIERGFQKSKCGILVLSRAFLQMLWSRRELDSLATLQSQHALLAIWRDVTEDEVRRYSEALLQLPQLPVEQEWDKLVDAIKKVVAALRPSNTQQQSNVVMSAENIALSIGGDFVTGNKIVTPVSAIKGGPLRGETESGSMIRLLNQQFSESELRTLGYTLNMNYDDMLGETKEEQVKEFVWQVMRRGRMDELRGVVNSLRPLTK